MRCARAVFPLLAVVAAACSPAGSGSADALFEAQIPRTIRVESPAFTEGETVPTRFTCDGEGLSPPLAWSGVPEGAMELAVVVDDPDAPGGSYVHWVVLGLDPGLGGLDEGVLPAGAGQAENSRGGTGYLGPCPPAGSEHGYRFAVYALREGPGVPDGAGTGEALDAIRAAAIAGGVLNGRYGR